MRTLIALIFKKSSQRISVDVSRRGGKAHENHDAIATGILTDGVDAKVGFPVVNGPNVSGLIDGHGGLTHHWYEAGRPWWLTITVQRHAGMQ
jgi:hypothetical protein